MQDRLRDHSEAFDSLLSLIPAKLYYGEEEKLDNQWQRKKQTKEQARAAKRGKLDPDSALNRNAKQVLDERARNKRKAKELDESEDDDDDDKEEEKKEDDDDDEEDVGGDEDDESVDLEGIEKEIPGQGLRKRKAGDDQPSKKKAKLAEPVPETDESTPPLSTHQQKKLAKLQKKAEKRAEKKASKPEKAPKKSKQPEDDHEDVSHNEDDEEASVEPQKGRTSKDLVPIDISGLADDEDANRTSQSTTPVSPTFDPPAEKPTAELASTTTSIASEAAGTTAAERPSSSSKKLKVPSDTTELRARLAAKIASLRAARKADGPDGTPIRTREELIESRRLKQIKSKAHKKELWQQQKAEEDKKREEALASARNSPMLSFGSPGSPEQENNFSFGRMTFTDGTQMSQDLSYVKDKSGKKKPNLDPKSALAKLEAQKKRLANLDDGKRKEVLEKETWLAARRRAEGEKVRNDESLLKKAVKRKEKVKKKSEKEWSDRIDGVKYAQKQKAQKREANIRQRKEQKQAGKAGKKGKGKGPTKKKARPGFEGGGFGGKKK
ncbi:unnamed protein product [Discula destructiva]